MPTINTPLGVATVAIPTHTSHTVEGLNGVTVNVAAQSPDKLVINTRRKKLSGSYKVAVALLGNDETNYGYTIGQSSAFSASVPVTAGQGLAIDIANADFSDYMGAEAICAAIFLQKGAAYPFLAGYAFIDAANDFSHFLPYEQFPGSPSFQDTLITGTTADPILGDRVTIGQTYTSLTPTTRGVEFVHRGTRVPISFDNTVDFNLTTARAVDCRFGLVRGDLEFVMRATGGDFVKWTYTDHAVPVPATHNIEEGDAELYTTAGNIQGNQSILVTQPPQPGGTYITRLLLGNLIVNQEDLTEAFRKDAMYVLEMNMQSGAFDYLTQAMGTCLYYRSNF